MRIILDNETKAYLKDIATTTENEHIVWVFKGNLVYITGYTSYYSEVLKLEVDSDIYGIYRMHVDNLKTMSMYEAVDIVEKNEELKIACYIKKQPVCALKIKKDLEISYTASELVSTIETLTKPKVFDIGVFQEYKKLLRIVDGGLSLYKGFLYGQGEGFRMYSIASSNFNFAVSNEVIRKMTKLLGDTTVAFDLGNTLVCERKGRFYLMFRKFRPAQKFDTTVLDIFPKLFSWELNEDIKTVLSNISSKDVTLTLLGDKKSLLIKSSNIEILAKLNISKCVANPNVSVKINKDILLTILKSTDFKKLSLIAYDRFILIKIKSIFFIIRTERD